jgi:hypothetical protein
MKQDRLVKRLAVAFILALALYASTYAWIEHRRKAAGPWQVTFTQHTSGAPALVVNQPALGITNVHVLFEGTDVDAITLETFAPTEPRAVPFDVSFGRCVFMDLTSLPGTIVLEMFGREIQFLPRVLTIDKVERPWQSGETLVLLIGNPTTVE